MNCIELRTAKSGLAGELTQAHESELAISRKE